jgi:hypothetical protein
MTTEPDRVRRTPDRERTTVWLIVRVTAAIALIALGRDSDRP